MHYETQGVENVGSVFSNLTNFLYRFSNQETIVDKRTDDVTQVMQVC